MTEKKSLGDVRESAKSWIKRTVDNRYFLLLLGILAFSAFIRYQHAFFKGMWVDESIHGRLAKELPKHLLSYSLPQMGGEMIKRPPVYNYLITFSNMIFGGWIGTDAAIRLVSPLMGTLGVAATYFLGREVRNREVGLIAAALVSVNGIFWFLSERILMGATLTTLFTVTVVAFHYGLEDRKYSKYAVWAWGPLIALTALSKQPGWILAPVILVYFLYRKRDALSDYFMTDKDFVDSRLYETMTERNYWIALGLFFAMMLPWMIRNMLVCQFPLCSFKLALETAVGNVGRQIDVQGPLFFVKSLPGILGLPVFTLVVLKALRSGMESLSADQDLMVKKIAVSIILVGGAYVLRTELVPLFLVSSIAMFARSEGEKLLWLTAGLGIGVMSINATKVARYIVFVVPSMIALASMMLWELSSWISSALPEKKVLEVFDARVVAMIFLAPILVTSFVQGQGMVSGHSFQALEPAGEWLDENTRLDESIVSTSPQIRYYAYPRVPVESANRIPDNESAFRDLLREENVSFVVVDVYERTQPDWMNLGLPPYRLTPENIRAIRSGQLSGRQVLQQYGRVPDYLTAFRSFGQTTVPLTNQTQPEVIIYVVNNSAL